jgi:hypothetical protein
MNTLEIADVASAEQERAEQLEVARRLYRALAAQDANRLIILSDAYGKVVARHDLQPEPSDPSLAS